MQVKAGTILVPTHGEYSDFNFDGPFVVLRDFDQKEVTDAFMAQAVSDDDRGHTEFVAWLSKEGYVQDVPTKLEWHLGDYELNPEIG